MALDKLVDSTKLDACLDAEADAIRAKTGDSNDITFDYANNKGFADAIAAIPSGTTITDGIVVKAMDASGYPTEIDYYGQLFPYALGATRSDVDYYLGKIERVNFKDTITSIPNYAFYSCAARGNGVAALTFPDVVSVGTSAFGGSSGNGAKIELLSFPSLESIGVIQNCFASKSIKQLYLPKLSTIGQTNLSYGICRFCTSMTYAEIGSIGYAAPDNIKYQFRDCTQSTLTICIYCRGSGIDSILPTLRTSATAATIVFKASEATTYNGTSYAAGDTILTSEVT